jgi:RNA polymerase sigma factor (sigma-70 family)
VRTTEDRASASWSDEHLVAAALGGDVEAFAAIYDRYADALFNACYRQLGNREEAADVVQDTFVLAREQLTQLRNARRLRSWLFTIATRQSLWVIRSRARSSPTDEFGDIVEHDAGPEEQAERSEIAVLLRAAAEGLSPTERSVLGLYLSGLTSPEIAQAVGLKLQAVHVCLHRLRGQVESSLGALLILRRGHRDCDGLATAVGSWDGQFSPLIRKRVARHVRDCEACGSRQARLLTREALLGLIPWIAVPAEVRAQVLDHVRRTLATGAVSTVGAPPDRAPLPSGVGVVAKVGAAAAVLTLLLGIGAMRTVERPEPETASPQAATQSPLPPAVVPAPASGSGTVADPAPAPAAPARTRSAAPAAAAPPAQPSAGGSTAPDPAAVAPASPAGSAPVDPPGVSGGRNLPVIPAAPGPVIAVAPQPAGGVGASTVPTGAAPESAGVAVPAPEAVPDPAAQPQAAAAEPEPSETGSRSPDPAVGEVVAEPGSEPAPEQVVAQPVPAPQPAPQNVQQPAPTAQPEPVTQPQVVPEEQVVPGKQGERLAVEATPDADEARRAEEAARLTAVAEQEGISGRMQEDGTFLGDNGLVLAIGPDGRIESRTPSDDTDGTGSDTPGQIREDGSWVTEDGRVFELGPTGEPRLRAPAEDPAPAEGTATGSGAATGAGTATGAADALQANDDLLLDEQRVGIGAATVDGAAEALGRGVQGGVGSQGTGTTGVVEEATDLVQPEDQTADPLSQPLEDPATVNDATVVDTGATGDDWWRALNGQSSLNGGTLLELPTTGGSSSEVGGSFPGQPGQPSADLVTSQGPR